MTVPSSRGLAALLIIAAGSLIAGLLALDPARNAGRDEPDPRRTALAAAANNLADRLDQGIYERSRDVQLAAQNDVLADPNASVDAKRAVLARWHELRPEYAIAVLASPEGRILATSNRLVEGADVSAREWFLKGRAGPAVVDVHDAVLLAKLLRTDGLNPPRFIDVVAPVRGRDGTLRGVLAVHLYDHWMDEVAHSVRATLGPAGAGLRLSVIGAGGQTLLDPATPLDVDAGRPGASITVATPGHREYPGLGWRVVARGPAMPEATGGLPPLLLLILPLGAVVLAGAGLLALARARSDAPHPTPRDASEAAPCPPAPETAEPTLAESGAAASALHESAPAAPEPAASDPAPLPEVAHRRQKVEALRQLTDGIAHDFTNLLTIVISNLELLRRRGDLADEPRRLVDAALRGAERGAALTERMLAFSHRLPAKPARTDVAAVVGGMCNLMSRSGLPGVDLRTSFPDGLAAAIVDAKQLEVALLNLVVNAQDAMQGGGLLTLSGAEAVVHAGDPVLAPGRYVRVTVADEGQGMDEATLARATEPFFSTKGGGQRSGLGLCVVQDIVARAGGALRLASEPGRGTSAELWLPSAAGASSLGRPARRAPRPVGSLDILLVDDDALVRACFAEMLGDLGHRVVEAESGRQALELLDGGARADVVVTDYAMPGMTGTELAALVTARRPRTRVVMASGYALCPDGVADRYPVLMKPVRQAEVQAVLEGLVERGLPADEEPRVLQFRRA